MTLGSAAPEPLPGLTPRDRIAQEFTDREAVSVNQYAAEDRSSDLAHYLKPDRWQPTVNWLRTKRADWQERRSAFIGHFIDIDEFTDKSGRKGLILAGCIAVGTLVALAAPTPEELHEQSYPTPPTTTTVRDTCPDQVTQFVLLHPGTETQVPDLLAECRHGESPVVQTILGPTPTS